MDDTAVDERALYIEHYTDSLDKKLIMTKHDTDSSLKGLTVAIKEAELSKDSLLLAWNMYYFARELSSAGKKEEASERYLMAKEIFKRFGDRRGVNRCEESKAESLALNGDLTNGASLLQSVFNESEQLQDTLMMVRSLNYLGYIAGLQKDLDRARKYYRQGADAARAIGWCSEEVNLTRSHGNAYKEGGNLNDALRMFQEADSLLQICDPDNSYLKAIIQVELAFIDREAGRIESYIQKLDSAQVVFDATNKYTWASYIRALKAEVWREQGDMKKSIQVALEGYRITKEHGLLKESLDILQELYRTSDAEGNFEMAYRYYRDHEKVKDSLVSRLSIDAMVSKELEFEHEKIQLTDSLEFARKEAVKDLEIKNKEANINRQRLALFSFAGGLLLIIALAFSIYKGKKRSDGLLLNILPKEVANELKKNGSSEAKLIDEVTVLFTDFNGFTALSEKLSPKELVSDLHECFTAFDNIIQKHGLEKIKTIGDAYMAAGGLPVPNKTHAVDVVHAALEIAAFIDEFKARKKANNLPYFEIRIGVHSGPVVAGIVGVKKFSYDIWGDTVNTASRMESSGETGKVNISGATYELVKSKFTCVHRGKITAKGKGEVDMYFVENA